MATAKKTSGNATRKKDQASSHSIVMLSLRVRETALITAIALAIFLAAALLSFQEELHDNFGGRFGDWLAAHLLGYFGYIAYLLPIIFCYIGWLIFRAKIIRPDKDYRMAILRAIGFVLFILSSTALANLWFKQISTMITAGGKLGEYFAYYGVNLLGHAGSGVVWIAMLLVGVTLLTGLSWLRVLDLLGHACLYVVLSVTALAIAVRNVWHRRRQKKRVINPSATINPLPQARQKKQAAAVIPPVITNKVKTVELSPRATRDRQVSLFKNADGSGGLPSFGLLDPPTPISNETISTAALETMSRQVEAKLLDFGIEVQVVAVHPGPVITRFEMQLAPGLKVSKISSLAKDLARSLSVVSVRIVDVIPGKTTVGLEVPNEHREVVRLSEVLASQQYDQSKSPLSLALGKDISGHPVIVDLAKMPHLLVAGTTGSGKSVGINAMILSLLFKATPEEVRMIMIDPKMLELSIYAGIPHLLTPVVTDMKEAANALRWCVAEMDRRYKLMAALGVRNLSSFNAKVKEAEKASKPIVDPLWKAVTPEESPVHLTTLPYVVVIIDEFADMMMVVGKKVEELIARIAQKARAAGIHMILATQRPSVDVITGLIKANVPTRIAFQVSSRIDSRTILDQQGAEQLLGNGDMLYLAPGAGVPVRVHGAFVADREVHAVVADWQQRGEPDYIESITSTEEIGEGGVDGMQADDAEADPLYDQAVQIVLQTRRASVSGIQRRLKIGYNRAARLVEAMEAAGLVGPMESNGNREVLAPDNSGER